jgi:hypothetical protein
MPEKPLQLWRHLTRNLFVAALFCPAAAYAQNAHTPDSALDPWKSLRFLIGTCEAKSQGGSAKSESSGTYTFQLELRNHILARHSSGEDCKGPADFNCAHSDLLYVYKDERGQPQKAIYFDNEGHVIYYQVSIPTASSAIFLSDPSRPGPQFRLSYTLNGSTMSGKFQIRMPGQAEFNSYLEWSGAKK